MSEKMRIDKFLSGENLGSRKEVGIMLRRGRVLVGGETVKNTDYKVDPENDEITLDGNAVSYQKFMYIMMNKPAGVLSATEDKKAKTVLDLVPAELARKGLAPAGRLDKDTTGLLIITNDGDFTHRMLSPKSHVYKLYEALLDTGIIAGDSEAFEKGVSENGQAFLPAKLWCENDENPQLVRVLIREGKFHQVKRMFFAIGKEVKILRRIQIGDLPLDHELQEGECRKLSTQEIQSVFYRQNA